MEVNVGWLLAGREIIFRVLQNISEFHNYLLLQKNPCIKMYHIDILTDWQNDILTTLHVETTKGIIRGQRGVKGDG